MQHSDDFNALCNDAKTRIKEVSIDEVAELLDAGKVDYLIDVRDADEFAEGNIPGATHLSKGWIEAKIHKIVDRKDANIVLHCGGGNRSALAADALQKMGYTNVSSMMGGYKGWVKAGKPTV